MQNIFELLKKLRDPLPENEISWRVGFKTDDGSKGQALPYVDNRLVQNHFDGLFGVAGWKNRYTEVIANGKLIAVRCGISIKVDGEWIEKEDAAPVTEKSTEFSIKGAYSDSMKRAAVQWGLGRHLYEFIPLWVDLDAKGRLSRIPTLSEGIPQPGSQLTKSANNFGPSADDAVTEVKEATAVKAEPLAKAGPAIKPAPLVTQEAVAEAAVEPAALLNTVLPPVAVTVKTPVVQAEPQASPKATTAAPAKPVTAATDKVSLPQPPTEHSVSADARAEAMADAAHVKFPPVEAKPLAAPRETGHSTTYGELLDKLKKLPPVMIRRYIEGPKGQEKLTEHERVDLLKLVADREAELTPA